MYPLAFTYDLDSEAADADQVVVIGNGVFVGNGFPEGDGYYGLTNNRANIDLIMETLYPGDAMQVEGPICWSSDFNTRTPERWKTNMDFLTYLQTTHPTKLVDAHNTEGGSNDEASRFYYASMMLIYTPNLIIGYSGLTYFTTSPNNPYRTYTNIGIGSPLDTVTQVGFEYVRHYTLATVSVNPTTHVATITPNP